MSGAYNRRITIQTKTESNTYGDVTVLWADTLTVWAEIVTSGGREYYAAQKLNAEVTAVFKTRYRSGIVTTQRIKYGTRYFEILSVNDVDMKHIELQISAREVV